MLVNNWRLLLRLNSRARELLLKFSARQSQMSRGDEPEKFLCSYLIDDGGEYRVWSRYSTINEPEKLLTRQQGLDLGLP